MANRTVKPAEAARQVGMDEVQLRAVNNIPKGMLVKAGSTLLVPRGAHRTEDVAEHIADHATLALAPDVPPMKPSTRGTSLTRCQVSSFSSICTST